MAPMTPVGFPARDGLEVHGYLSFPPGSSRSGLPTGDAGAAGPLGRQAHVDIALNLPVEMKSKFGVELRFLRAPPPDVLPPAHSASPSAVRRMTLTARASRRQLALDPFTVAALKAHRVRQLEERLAFAVAAPAWGW